jgi:hypothetical protein
MTNKIIQHNHPAWRNTADFIIRAECYDAWHREEPAVEQLWAHKISEGIYELCCIPLFLYNISLGDQVKTDSDYWITEVVKPSGHYTFRVWFGDSKSPGIQEAVKLTVEKFGGLYEWYTDKLLAIDVPSHAEADGLAAYLQEMEDSEELTYETGKL